MSASSARKTSCEPCIGTDIRVRIHLKTPDATMELGRKLAACLLREGDRPAILLHGDLGSGKTTLVRGLIPSLPGGREAEVSSPSFNIVNLYPTVPPTAHFDLYRLGGMGLEGDLEEQLHDPNLIRIVEWAEHLSAQDRPDDILLMTWEPCPEGRTVVIAGCGSAGRRIQTCLQAFFPDS